MRQVLISTLFAAAFSVGLVAADPAPTYPYQDATKPAVVRAEDLASRMTVDEKIDQLQHTAPEIKRLGVPRFQYWNEALHGTCRGTSTVFPVPALLGCTWDDRLIFDIGSAIADEGRIDNGTGLDYWCPNVNLQRDPRWGRNEEVFGEDPYHMSRLAVAFVKGMQGDDPHYFKAIATPKHYIANTTDSDRHRVNEAVDERSLREYYLVPFRACIVDGKADSIMAAYNAVNGVPMPCSTSFIDDILRKEWGFSGYVVSDCGAVSDVFDGHHYTDSGAKAAAACIKAGLDLCCGDDKQWLADAYKQGLISVADLNRSVARLMEARIRLGDFDPPSDVPYNSISKSKLCSPEFQRLAYKAACEGIVLLKNEGNLLPLDNKKVKSIAVIGPDADRCILGSYSGSPMISVTPLDGIAAKMGSADPEPRIFASSAAAPNKLSFKMEDMGCKYIRSAQNGAVAEYKGIDLTGTNALSFCVCTSGNRPKTPDPSYGVDDAGKSACSVIEIRLDDQSSAPVATLHVPFTDQWSTFAVSVSGITGTHDVYLRFMVPAEVKLDMAWFQTLPLTMRANQSVTFNRGGVQVWQNKVNQAEVDKAVAAAKQSDVAVVFVGTDNDTRSAGEGRDRDTIALPGSQEALVKAVVAANPRTIVVLINGYSLGIDWEQAHVPAIVCAWYGGQAQGAAIADTLFGDNDPSGRLSETWFASDNDLPDFHDNDITHNRTYMYFTGKPLYPFGYGLSYTTFHYSDLSISAKQLKPDGTVSVTCRVTNTGSRAGDEVAQLYVGYPQLSVATPSRVLKDFDRVPLGPGQSKSLTFSVPCSSLAFWDVTKHKFVVQPGRYYVNIGRSSVDLPLSDTFQITL